MQWRLRIDCDLIAAAGGAYGEGLKSVSAISVSAIPDVALHQSQREAVALGVLAVPPELPLPAHGVVRTARGGVLRASRSRPVVRWVVTERSSVGMNVYTVVGKVYGRGGGDTVDGLMRRLWAAGFDGAYAIPRPLGYVPDRALLLQSEAPPRTLHDGLANPVATRDDVRRAGVWLARLHAVAGTDLRPLAESFEAAKIDRYVGGLIALRPELTRRLRDLQRQLVPALDASSAGPFVVTHGDFQPKNVHLDDASVVVIDFDRAALAPPARDLGHFVGQALTMAAARSQGFDATVRSWCDALLDGYVQEGGSQAVDATPAYVSRTFLEVLFYRLVVRPVADASFAAEWLDECDAWLDRCPQPVT